MIFTHGRAKEMLCKCCANLGIKKVKVLKISTLTLTVVGITALLKISKNLSYRIFLYI